MRSAENSAVLALLFDHASAPLCWWCRHCILLHHGSASETCCARCNHLQSYTISFHICIFCSMLWLCCAVQLYAGRSTNSVGLHKYEIWFMWLECDPFRVRTIRSPYPMRCDANVWTPPTKRPLHLTTYRSRANRYVHVALALNWISFFNILLTNINIVIASGQEFRKSLFSITNPYSQEQCLVINRTLHQISLALLFTSHKMHCAVKFLYCALLIHRASATHTDTFFPFYIILI